MWKLQRATIVINDNAIEQVSAFKHLGYLTAEYISDLGDKLPAYYKLNADILETDD
jgi:hypothetical protein